MTWMLRKQRIPGWTQQEKVKGRLLGKEKQQNGPGIHFDDEPTDYFIRSFNRKTAADKAVEDAVADAAPHKTLT